MIPSVVVLVPSKNVQPSYAVSGQGAKVPRDTGITGWVQAEQVRVEVGPASSTELVSDDSQVFGPTSDSVSDEDN